jgi:hypothetical protein
MIMKHYDTFTGVITEQEIEDLEPIDSNFVPKLIKNNTDETSSPA